MKSIRKFLLSLFLIFILLIGLTACSGEDVQNTVEDTISTEESDEAVTDDQKLSDETDELASSSSDSIGQEESTQENQTDIDQEEAELLDPDGSYTTKEDVALYLYQYGELPSNFITKKEAQALGWEGGSLEPYAPGKCIGGTTFGNYEGILPQKEGRTYKECDIDTLGASKRGAKRIVYSNDGLIYYTEDHYESFELLYGNP